MTDRERRIDSGSPEERVKAKYPDAWAEVSLGMRLQWIIWPKSNASSNLPMQSLSLHRNTESEAWADAARRLADGDK